MPQGLEAFNAAGVRTFSTSDRLARILFSGVWHTSTVPALQWVQIVAVGYQSTAWGLFIPLYSLDDFSAPLAAPGYEVLTHPSKPGQIFVLADKDPAHPAILLYGVY